MIDRLNIIVSRYNEIQEELLKPEILGDYSKMKTLSKEKSDLEEIVKKYDEYKETQKRIDDAKALINDPEMHDLAEMELDEATESLKTITHELEILLIPKDENDGKNIIMEIRGAAGGDDRLRRGNDGGGHRLADPQPHCRRGAQRGADRKHGHGQGL